MTYFPNKGQFSIISFLFLSVYLEEAIALLLFQLC